MQTTLKKATDKKKDKSKDETPRKSKDDDKLKKGSYGVSTPRNFVPKSSTVDIYGQKNVQSARAPKKSGTTHTSRNVTPSTDFLKSSPSSISQASVKSERKPMTAKIDAKIPNSARKKELPFSNVTVNSPLARRKMAEPADSPMARRRLNLTTDSKTNSPITQRAADTNVNKKYSSNRERLRREASNLEKHKEVSVPNFEKRKEVSNLERGDSKDIELDRQRSKTRTLDIKEVKVLNLDGIDNNTEMINLSKKLNAKPKAFYVGLDGDSTQNKSKSSDEEVSYEDDFESYESDFDSYHSDQSAKTSNETEQSQNENGQSENENDQSENELDQGQNRADNAKSEHKDGKDEEKMLDSGSFDLREQRSANRFKPEAMGYILEGSEDDKIQSLTDEGFQDMSSSSAVSSMKTQVEVLDRPLFIDFTKSKETKRKKRLNEKLKQRANDLLSMITLHEMSYTLFEMKPIPYDLFMVTFGRSNYTQIAVQTFDDGIAEEVQTEEILSEHKWTQHPIEFSKSDIYLYPQTNTRKYSHQAEDYLTKFSFLTKDNQTVEVMNKMNSDITYKENPLRIYLEQKDGAGSAEMLPYETYKNKINDNDFNVNKLKNFLKKVENRVSKVLSGNAGSTDLTQLTKESKLPFSKGFLTLEHKKIQQEELAFLKYSKITNLIFSQSKNNLLISVHKKSNSSIEERCTICLWDVSLSKQEPLKILTAIDNVAIGRYKGGSDGIFIAALEDGSIQLWDLSEEPTWRNCVASAEKPADLVEVNSDRLTQTEIDREWNLKNSSVGCEKLPLKNALQACAYTNSAANLTSRESVDCVVGLAFLGDTPTTLDAGRKIIGQICALQRIGIITTWSIVQERKGTDIGKAYWSKMKLEKAQTINLVDHIGGPLKSAKSDETLNLLSFNLNAAKRRLSSRKVQKNTLKRQNSRPKSSDSSNFDVSRPSSAVNVRKVLPIEKKSHESWENGIICCDLEIVKVDEMENYLVAKNCGEVLCCSKYAGAIRITRFCVATDTSTVTSLEASPHGLPYFLAATDSGTVNLCSLVDWRVLLTLDCRNGPPELMDRCQADHKGRFISSAKVRSPTHTLDGKMDSKLQISSVHWSSNPCALYTLTRGGTLALWELTHSDIRASCLLANTAVACASSRGALALLTPEGEIQVHKLSTAQDNTSYLDLFQKYVSLL